MNRNSNNTFFNLDSSGFTLVELMVALMVLLIGLLGVWSLNGQTLRMTSYTTKRNIVFKQVYNMFSDPLLSNITSDGSACYICDADGKCEYQSCEEIDSGSSSYLPIIINWNVVTAPFSIAKKIGQLTSGSSNSTANIQNRIIYITVGWGGAGCQSDIEDCLEIINFTTMRPL